MLFHLGLNLGGHEIFAGGFIGVQVFFVLSGFLITSLLIGEWDRTGGIDFRAFYARRALRLFPALAAVIAVTVIAVMVLNDLHSFRHTTLTSLPFVIFYVGNLRGTPNLGLFAHTWSLAVEEQFYFLFPVICLLLLRRSWRRDLVALGVAVLACAEIAYKCALLATGAPSSWTRGLQTNSDGLLLGVAIAFYLASRRRSQVPARPAHAWALVGVGGMLVLVMLPETTIAAKVAFMVLPLLAALVLVDQVASPLVSLQTLLSAPPVVWIGKRSYGLYLWHFPIYTAVRNTAWWHLHQGVGDLAAFGLAFVTAATSYKLLERPALRLKVRFQASEALPAALATPV